MLVEVDSLSLYEVGAIAAAIVAAVIVSAKRMRSLRTRSACLPASLEGKVEAVFVAEAKIVDGAIFPLTLKPVVEDAQDPSAEHRLAFVRAHRDELLSLVRSRGAVLLRGWGPCSAEHFSESEYFPIRTRPTCCSLLKGVCSNLYSGSLNCAQPGGFRDVMFCRPTLRGRQECLHRQRGAAFGKDPLPP